MRSQPDRFDLVVTDLTMPEMTGTELGRNVLKTQPGMPIILATGFRNAVTAEAAKEMGIRELVLKPFVAQDLGKTIRLVLDQPES